MTDECKHLSYRTEGDGKSFDVARAFCNVTESFVQPMRADICNRRYGLDPETDCEYYIAAEKEAQDAEGADDSDADDLASDDLAGEEDR